MKQRLEISSEAVHLARVRAFVRDLCVRAGCDEDAVMQLELAVDEAAANVVDHAYKGRADGWVEIEVKAEADRIGVVLRHRGAAFDRDQVAAPSFDGSRDRGFGVYIIEQCVDEVSYFTEDGQTHCIGLVKYRSQGGAEDPAADNGSGRTDGR